MKITCRLALFLALSCWMFTSCERHEIVETKVLHGGHGHHGDHGDGHDDHGHGHDDHGHKDGKGHKDEKAHDEAHADDEHKSGASPSKEEPRSLGI